ncbi:MAG TPA: hypothetical protein EYP53_02140 [Candidatus Latescibacteria bacterium]|nr:hypothetical protein [Candidatus Latescibacterota bacterium]
MVLLAAASMLFFLYLWSLKAFEHRALPAPIKDLLSFRLQYLVLGLLFGALLPDDLSGVVHKGSYVALGFLTGWIGFLLGTSLDLRVIRRTRGRTLLSALSQTVFTFLFVSFFAYWMINLADGRSRAVSLSLGAIASTTAVLSAHLQSREKIAAPLNKLEFGNSISIVLLALIFSAYSEQAVFLFGVLQVSIWWQRLVLSAGIGAFIGVLCDFLFREQRPLREEAFLLFATLLLGCGMAVGIGLSPLLVGMLTGIWLINSTLRRIPLLEMVQRVEPPLDGVFLTLVGGVLGITWAGALKEILLAPVLFFLLMGIGKITGMNIVSRLFESRHIKSSKSKGFQQIAQGSLAIAIALQAKWYLEEGVGHHILLIAVLTVILSRLTASYTAAKRHDSTDPSIEPGRALPQIGRP